MSLTARSPFRARGPFRLRGPWRLVAGQPWGVGGAESFFDGGKTFDLRKMTLVALLAAGLSNAQATTNPPGTVVGRDGTVGYAPHNCSNSSVVDGTWGKAAATSITPGYGVGPTGEASTLVTTSTTNGGWIERTAIIRTTGAYVSLWARSVNGVAGTISLYTNGGTYTSSPQTVPANGAWTLLGYSAPSATSNSCGFYANTVGCQYEVSAWNVSCGDRRSGDVPTSGAAVYAPRLTCDRGATSNVLQWSNDLSQSAWTKTGLGTVTAGAGAAGMTRVREDTGTGSHEVSQAYVVPTTGAYVMRVRVAVVAGTRSLMVNANGTSYTHFDLQTLTVITAQQAGVSWARIEPVGDGTYILWVCFTSLTAGGNNFSVRFKPSTTVFTTSYTGDGVSGFDIGDFAVRQGIEPFAYLRTFGTTPLYSAGTPTSQNLVASSDDWGANQFGSAQCTVSAAGVTIGATPSGAYSYKQLGVTAVGCVHTARIRVAGPAGRTVGLRLRDGGSLNQFQTITLSATPTVYTMVFVPTSASAVSIGLDNRAPYVSGGPGTMQTGDVVTIDQVAAWEGTGDMPLTPTNGTPVSVYPQRAMKREPQRTNGIRNSQMVGAAAGTPGTLPTNWASGIGAPGTLAATIATGTALGQPYIDYKLTGTSAGAGSTQIVMESGLVAAALTGQAWTNSAFLALVGGSLANVTVSLNIDEYTSGGAYVTTRAGAAITPDATLKQYQSPLTLAGGATTAFAKPTLTIAYAGAVAIDITLRILMPQLEQGAWATTWIPTTTAAVTRSADLLRPGSLITDGPMTVLVQARADKAASGANQCIVGRSGGFASVINAAGLGGTNDGTQATSASPTLADGVSFRLATRWSASGQGASANGSAVNTAAFDGSMGSGTAGIGDNGAGAFDFSGDIEFVGVVGQAATDAQLQQLSAGTLQ